MTPVGRAALGVLAFVLGSGAVLADDPPMPVPAHALIQPLDLARRIMDRDRRLVLVDLRSVEEFESYHIPTARRLSLPLEETDLAPDAVVVVYGDDSTRVARAREALLSADVEDVRILEGGVAGWLTRVMNPVLADDVPDEERRAFLDAAEVSRYFGGAPRIVPRGELEEDPGAVAEIVEEMRLRGCRGG